MKTNPIYAAAATTLLITLTNPTLATAASSSLTLSNITVTSTPQMSWDTEALANWMEGNSHRDPCDPTICGFPSSPPQPRDNAVIYADMLSSVQYQSGESQTYYDGGVIVNSGGYHSVSSSAIPGIDGNGVLTTGLHIQYVYEYVNVSPELTKSSYSTSATVYSGSEEYFRHFGPASEINISADYSVFSDPGDNSVPGNAYTDIKLTAYMNGVNSVIFDRLFNFSSATDPGAHNDSGTLFINFIVPEGFVDGGISWEIRSSASLTPGVTLPGSMPVATPVPEPQTYAMLLAGIGLIAYRRILKNENKSA